MASQTILTAGVRSDLASAHADTMAELGQPGDWMRADERTATIRVVRAARQNSEQPPWYQPSTDPDHATDFAPLAPAAIDAAWRLTNHPGTLTAEWYADIVSTLPSPEYYVELTGIVAVMNAVDRLASLLDFDVIEAPDAAEGDPLRPAIDSAVTTHWVPTAVDMPGPNVLKATSTSPSVLEMRTRIGAAHYMSREGMADLNWSRGELDRRQIELIAGVTSMHNECFY